MRAETPSTHEAPSQRAGPYSRDLTVVQLVNVVLRARVAIVLTAVLIAIFTGALVLLQPRTYTSTMSFLPQGGKPASPLSGFAAQFGVDVSGAAPGSSPQFYAQLADSRHLLSQVAEQSFVLDGRSLPLADILGTKRSNPVVQRELTVRALQDAVSTAVDPQTSIVSVRVKGPAPRVARDLAGSVLAAISQYNVDTRQSQARAERLFTERQLGDAATELRSAEDALEAFLQSNRVLVGSPSLIAEKDRLSTRVALRNQIYGQLTAAYQQAKLDEVRDTPVLTVLDPPEASLEPDARGLVTKTLLGFIIGAVIAAVLAVLINRLRADSDSGSDAEEFAALRQAALADLKHPVRALSQRLGSRAMRRSKERGAPASTQH